MTDSASGFSALGLGPQIESTLARLGLTTPTPVQLEAIPLLRDNHDLIASAPTGTGKTAAFLLPSLVRLSEPPKSRSIGPRIMVLTPTRELAQQVAQAAKSFSGGMSKVKTVCVTGGESYREQNRLLAAPHEILVATPGRLMDQMQSGHLDFSRLEVLILDEADRMLDMGFAEDVLAIAAKLPEDRQTVCFTATLSRSIQDLSHRLQREPKIIEVKAEVSNVDAIDQKVVYVDNFGHKRRLLSHWLADAACGQAVIFTGTKRDAEALAEALDAEGHAAVALHGDLQQRQRTRMLNQLRRGDARILVATDVAARGIDVPAITHVFNFDLPRFAEDYVHRIGRTGRAGASGVAVSFVGREDIGVLRRIERFIGRRVAIDQVEGMEAHFDPNERRTGGRPFEARRGGYGDRRPQGSFSGRREESGFSARRPEGDRKPFGERSASSERPAFADRKPFADRPAFGDRKPFADRAASPERSANSGRGTFSDRPAFGDRKPFADRKPFGDRKAPGFGAHREGFSGERSGGDARGFGERKSFGDRKGFGEGRPSGFNSDRPRRKFEA